MKASHFKFQGHIFLISTTFFHISGQALVIPSRTFHFASDMMQDGTYIRATNLTGLDDIVAEKGANFEALLDEVGIPPNALRHASSLISFQRFAYLMELISVRFGMPHLGLEWTARSIPHFAGLGPLILSANFVKTFGEWIETSQRYWSYHSNAFTMDKVPSNDGAIAQYRFKGASIALPGRQFSESCMANLVCIARTITQRADAAPKLLRLQHAKAAPSHLYAELFKCDIEFGADHMEVLFDKSLLGAPTGGHLSALKPLMTNYVKWRISRMPVYDQSVATTVSHAIGSLIGAGKCNIEFVAAALDQNVKQLQRALAQRGPHFLPCLKASAKPWRATCWPKLMLR